MNGNGFARAQADYDAQMPPEDCDCPKCTAGHDDHGIGSHEDYMRDRQEQDEDDARDARLDREYKRSRQ